MRLRLILAGWLLVAAACQRPDVWRNARATPAPAAAVDAGEPRLVNSLTWPSDTATHWTNYGVGLDGALDERAEFRLETNYTGAHRLRLALDGPAPRVLVNGAPVADQLIEAGRLRVDGYTVVRLEGARGTKLRRVELRPAQ